MTSGGLRDTGANEGREVSIARVVASFPEAIAQLFDRLMREPRRSREELRRRVASYLVSIESLAREVDFVDVDLVETIANRCHRLIETLDAGACEDHRRLVQAAVLYFVLDEDAEADTSSLIGFDDDRLVVDTVARELGVGS
jgi:uncharacterized membrane protein YkvA (DUF1232 family)